MALGAAAAPPASLVLRRCRAPARGAAGQDRGAAPPTATHRTGQSAEAESPDRPPAGCHRLGHCRVGEAATRLQGTRDQVEGPRRDHRDRHLPKHALDRHRPDAPGARQADRPGSSGLSQGGPRRPDRLRRGGLPTGAADPRQGGRAHLARGSRHEHHSQGWHRHRLGDPDGDRGLRQGGGDEPRTRADDRWRGSRGERSRGGQGGRRRRHQDLHDRIRLPLRITHPRAHREWPE